VAPADISVIKNYLKDKINEHATNSKNKNITDIYRDINDLLADSHNILNM
jgi:hypothetical protein